MSLNYLSENIFNEIAGFLDLKSLIYLKNTNVKCFIRLISNNKLFSNFFFKEFFDINMNVFWEYSFENDFINNKIKQNQNFIEKFKNEPKWRKILLSSQQIKYELKLFFSSNSETNLNELVDSLSTILRNPILPSISLMRENFGIYTQSLMQSKLTEIAVLGNKRGNFFSDNNENLDIFIEKIFMNYELLPKDELINIRWFNTDLSTNEINPIALFNKLVQKLIKNYLKGVYEFILNINDPFEIINEYISRWTGFVCSMYQFDGLFKKYVDSINSIYESQFKEYPCFPKYSFIRIFTKLWIKYIYNKLNEKLINSFMQIVNYLRNLNLIEMGTLYYENMEFLDENKFFSKDCSKISNLLSSFLKSITDISINEFSVHYLGHSELQTGKIYTILESAFENGTRMFYAKLSEYYLNDLKTLNKILISDYKIFKSILNQKQRKIIKCMGLEIWNETFNLRMVNSVLKYINEGINNQINEKSYIFDELYELLINSNGFNWIYPLKTNIDDEQLKCIINYAAFSIENEQECISLYKEKNIKINQNHTKKIKDDEIEQNISFLNIPLKMDKILYDFLDFYNAIDINVLEQMKNYNKDQIAINEEQDAIEIEIEEIEYVY